MALIVETGAGLANAESYASVADADARCASLGVVKWAALAEPEKEIALRKAAAFMVQNYRTQWMGRRMTRTQALDWPRYGVEVDSWIVDSNVVPADIVAACIDLAVRAASGELLPDLDTGTNQIRRDKVGPLETDYFENNVSARDRFLAVDATLWPYFGTGGGSSSIVMVRG